MASFLVTAMSLGCEEDGILKAHARVGHPMLNGEALMVRDHGSFSRRSVQWPLQA